MKKTFENFNQLMTDFAQQHQRKRLAVVCPDDDRTIESVLQALNYQAIDALMVCINLLDPRFEIYGDHVITLKVDSADEAAKLGVNLIREKKADILMKGLIGSDVILRAVLNKDTGILPSGRVLTHLCVADIPTYHKLLCYTDAAVIPYPTQDQRIAQVSYLADYCHRIGIHEPKIALLHCTEKVDGRHFPYTLGYELIKTMAAQGDFGPCIVDGPLDLKAACSSEAMKVKHIASPIVGDADGLVFPDILAANLVHKAITLFCGAEIACLVQGTEAPIVLPSRSDSTRTKLLSIALACRILS